MSSDQFLEHIIGFSPIVVYTQVSSTARLDYVSANVVDILGYTVEDAAENWLSFVHPDDLDRGIRAHDAAAKTGEGFAEVRFRHPGGGWRLIECRIRRLPGSGGLVGYTRDVTAERDAQRRLAQGQQLSVLGRISAGVAHDFNNMLAVILLNVETLRQRLGADTPELAQITSAVAHASGVVEGLLSFASGRSGDRTAVDLSELLRRLLSTFQRLIPPGVELQLDLADDLPPISADPAALERLVINLVVNSCDAMSNGGRLRLATRDVEPRRPLGSRTVELMVEDSGDGIAADLLPTIFEPFVTSKEGGSGLGLAVAHAVVSELHGEIRIDSILGAGTTVTVELPSEDAGARSEAEQRRTSPKPLARLLVVDDVAEILDPIAELLRSEGYDVLTASSGEEALDVVAASHHVVDLLLTDISMPAMQGTELARRLRQRLPRLKVVYMSGFSRAHGDGDGPVVSKPFSVETITDVIHRALQE